MSDLSSGVERLDTQDARGTAGTSPLDSGEPASRSSALPAQFTLQDLVTAWAKLQGLEARAESLPDPSLDRHYDYLPLNKWDETLD